MNDRQVISQIAIDGSVGDCQIFKLANGPVQPGGKVLSDVSSKNG